MIWLRRLGALLVFAAGAAFIASADMPVMRYASVSSMHACSVRQLTNLPQELDVIVLGSSRVRRGVDPTVMMRASDGAFASVYNLSRPQTEAVRNAVIFRDLIASGRAPRVLVLELDIDSIRRGAPAPWQWTNGAAGFSTWSDILTATPTPRAASPDPRLVLDGLRQKLTNAALLAASGVLATVLNDTDTAPPLVCTQRSFDRETPGKARARERARARNAARFRNLDTAFETGFRPPTDARSAVELDMLERIRIQAREAGVHLIVVRPQGYMTPPYHPRVIAEVQRIIPEFRTPPEALARRLSRTHIDGNHFGPEGRRLYTRWLTETILAELPAEPTDP